MEYEACWEDMVVTKNTFLCIERKSERRQQHRVASAPPVLRHAGGDQIMSEGANSRVAADVQKPQLRTRLRTSAKAFVSRATTSAPDPAVPVVAAEIEAAMAEVQAVLTRSAVAVRVARHCFQNVWTIVATVPVKDGWRSTFMAECAQRALSQHADRSKLFLLGNRGQQIKWTRSGFEAAVCIVDDVESFCWDVLSSGVCHRGCACHWGHPAQVALIRVSVTVAGPK